MNKILLALILAGSAQAAPLGSSPQEYFHGHEYMITINGTKKAVRVYRRVGTYGQLYEVEIEREGVCYGPLGVVNGFLRGCYLYGRWHGGTVTELCDFTKVDPVEFNANNDFPFPKDYDPEKAPRRIQQNRMKIEDMEKAEMEKAGK